MKTFSFLYTAPLAVLITTAFISPVNETQDLETCTCDSVRDSLALVDLYNATNGSNWTITWELGMPMASFHGVIFDQNGCVTELELPENNLVGTIPTSIGNLSELTYLELGDNNLEGGIPETVGMLKKLSQLRLGNTGIGGTIPESIGSMDALQRLVCFGCNLSGTIPDTLRNLSQLTVLDFQFNPSLTGPLPEWLGSLSKLTSINFITNNLNGSIPASLGQLQHLRGLFLDDNMLSGAIPSELGNTTSLETIGLSGNQLNDTIPASLCNLDNLKILRLNDNTLIGSLPDSLGKLTNLEFFYAQNNRLSGNIPASLSNITNLTELNLCCQKLGENIIKLTGEIPPGLGQLTNLTNLQLHQNDLTGEIPIDFGNLVNLTTFRLYDNKLSGEIPSSLSQLQLLTELNLSNNQLSGAIPNTIGDMSNLQVLDLSNNQLGDDFPGSLANLDSLIQLDLSYNELTGSIPTELVEAGIAKLDLSYNQLEGNIPIDIFDKPSMEVLRLNNNALTGNIPVPQGLNSLLELLLSNNQLSGIISSGFDASNLSSIKELRLDDNQLQGTIPESLGELSNLIVLDLSINQFEGNIPFEAGDLPALELIFLAKNNLTGVIPPAFSGFTSLRLLALNGNAFSGEIPEGLGNLPNLIDLYVGDNNLSGCIPQDWFNLCDRGADVYLEGNPMLLNDDFEAFCSATGEGSGVCLTNYECSSATVLPINAEACDRNYRAVKLNLATTSTPNPSLSCSNTFVGNDVWFKVALPSTGNVLIKSDSITTINPAIEAYEGADCNTLSAIQCAELDSLPFAVAIEGQNFGLTAGDTVWLRIWDQNNSVVNTDTNAVVALTAHFLPIEKESWELCDFPATVLNDTLSAGTGNRSATQFIVQYNSDATAQDITEVNAELGNEGAVLLRECPCRSTPLQLWISENPIEMETERQTASKKSKVDTSNYNYLLESRDFIGNSFTEGQQINSSTAIDAAGNFFMTWQDNGRYRYAFSLYGQRFDAANERVGAEFKISDTPVGGQENPDVTMHPDGQFVTVWMEGKSLGRKEIKAQLFNANGSKNGSALDISNPRSGYSPSVAIDTSGHFVIAWHAPDASGFGIYAQQFDENGVALAPVFQVNSFTNGTQQLADIAMNVDGTFVIVWQGGNFDGSGTGVFGTLYNELGEAIRADFQINTYFQNDQSFPTVAMNESGAFVVVWQSDGQDGSDTGVFAQRFDASGNPVGAEIAVNTTTADDQAKPAVVLYEDGGFLVVWESQGQDGSGGGIYGQLFDPSGNKIGGEILINSVTEGTQLQPSIAKNQSEAVIVSWESYGQDGSAQGIFGQKFQTTGTGASRSIIPSDEAKLSAGLGLLQRFSNQTYTPVSPQVRTLVALTDTGVKSDHPELQNAIWMNEEENDGDNCLVGDLIGYDFTANDGDPEDIDGHGTGVNGAVVRDFPEEVQLELMNLKFYENQRGTVFDAICGIYYAVDEGANIINLSWGFESAQFPQILYDALAYAAANDVLLVASAGNTSKNNDLINKYPANFDLPNLIVATAYQIDEDSVGVRLANYASYGVQNVDLAARGYVETTALGDSLSNLAGTSLAAPAVTRTAAAIKGKHPTLTALEIKDCILQSVDVISGLDTLVATGGVLNDEAALACAAVQEFSCRTTDFTIENSQSQNATYQTTGSITMNATVFSGTTTTVQAVNSVTLSTGFHAEAGATFTANTNSCNSSENALLSQNETHFDTSKNTTAKSTFSTTAITIAPNPAAENIQISWHGKGGETQFRILDINGRVLKSQVFTAFARWNQQTIAVNDLPQGIYLINIQTAEGVQVEKFVVKRL